MQTEIQTLKCDAQPLAMPRCEFGLGKLVSTPQTPMIDGIRVEPFSIWPDDRGYFLEMIRMGRGLAADFPLESTQISAALSYAGTIKAFHYHQYQTDLWVPAVGLFQVALVDLRCESPTFGVKNTLYVGSLRPWQILIPPGVGHGYKVIGQEHGVLLYATNRFYNPEDEGRIPYNDPGIAYDWEIQHK